MPSSATSESRTTSRIRDGPFSHPSRAGTAPQDIPFASITQGLRGPPPWQSPIGMNPNPPSWNCSQRSPAGTIRRSQSEERWDSQTVTKGKKAARRGGLSTRWISFDYQNRKACIRYPLSETFIAWVSWLGGRGCGLSPPETRLSSSSLSSSVRSFIFI
jgi:hypothetical protein